MSSEIGQLFLERGRKFEAEDKLPSACLNYLEAVRYYVNELDPNNQNPKVCYEIENIISRVRVMIKESEKVSDTNDPTKKAEAYENKKANNANNDIVAAHPRCSKTAGDPPPPKVLGDNSQAQLQCSGNQGAENTKLEGIQHVANPTVKWDEVIGMEKAKQAIREAVLIPQIFPQSGQAKNSWKGILLYGPSGVGKTLLVKAVACEANMAFITVKLETILSKWVGQSEKMVAQLCKFAIDQSPSILFIDEVDALCSSRSENDADHTRKLKTAMLLMLDQLISPETNIQLQSYRVIIIGNTNFPAALDVAFRRRFPKRIYVGLPNSTERKQLLLQSLKDFDYSLAKSDLALVVNRLAKYSGADIKALVTEASMVQTKKMDLNGMKLKYENGNHQTQISLRPINKRDFDLAIECIKPTNDRAIINSLKTFKRKFGSKLEDDQFEGTANGSASCTETCDKFLGGFAQCLACCFCLYPI